MDNPVWRPASFRGVPFFVESFDVSGGRRGPDHEFPGKDEGYPEDTGGKMRVYQFQAYVVRSAGDDDYGAKRDSLIEALEQEGPGTLVHPVHGSISVQVRDYDYQENKETLGKAVFKLSFRPASEATYPTATRSSSAGMPGATSAAHQAAASLFNRRFSVAGKHDYLRDRAGTRLLSTGLDYHRLTALNAIPVDIEGLIQVALQVLTSLIHDGDTALSDAIAALPCSITDHYEAPWKHKRNLDGTYRGGNGYASNGPLSPVAVTSLARMFGSTEPAGYNDIPETFATGRVEQANADALDTFVRQTAVIEAARVAPFVNWRTLDDAERYRDRIADALDYEAESTDDDDVYRTFTAMRILVLQSVTPDDGSLPRLVNHTPTRTMPSLVLAYKLYGSAASADELAAINGLRHPGFIPGAEPVRVLSDA